LIPYLYLILMFTTGDGSTRSLIFSQASGSTTFNGQSTWTISLPNMYAINKDEISLKTLDIYYSWNNITVAKNNNSFSYIWTNGTTYNVSLPDGTYQFADVNGYFQLIMHQNGHYLVDQNGNNVYYLSLDANSIAYRVTLTATPIPASLPSGWSNPASVNLAINNTPQLVVPNTGFATLIGFIAGTYPASPITTIYQFNGQNVPVITAASSISVNCSAVNNGGLTLNSQTIATFAPAAGLSSGTLISYQPTYASFYPAQTAQTVSAISLTLVDTNGNPLIVVDPTGFNATIDIRARRKYPIQS
jgi:hypothetical protein